MNYSLLLGFLFLNFPFIQNSEVKNNALGSGLSPDKFGPIKLKTEFMKICKGPKRYECNENRLVTDDTLDILELTQVYNKNTEFVKIKIAVYINETTSSSKTPDFVKWVNKPCQHFLLGPFLCANLNMNPKKCIVGKGTHFVRFNATALFYGVFGGNFFYGNYRVHSTVLSKDCNILCIMTQYTLQKPTNIRKN